MKHTNRTLVHKLFLSKLVIMFLVFFNINGTTTYSQDSAFCQAACPGGCAFYGFDAAACDSGGCACWCIGIIDGDVYQSNTNCFTMEPI